jgi:hypothetical protein
MLCPAIAGSSPAGAAVAAKQSAATATYLHIMLLLMNSFARDRAMAKPCAYSATGEIHRINQFESYFAPAR